MGGPDKGVIITEPKKRRVVLSNDYHKGEEGQTVMLEELGQTLQIEPNKFNNLSPVHSQMESHEGCAMLGTDCEQSHTYQVADSAGQACQTL